MDTSNDAVVKFGSFEGKAELEYTESDRRFTVRKKASNSGAGIVAGMMFGALGRMAMDGLMNGKEVGSFAVSDIAQVRQSTVKRKTIYYLYPHGSAAPYEITIETDTYMNTVIQTVFADRMADVVAKNGSGQAAVPKPPVQPFGQTPAAQPVQPPAAPYIPAPPVQPAYTPTPAVPPVQPVQPPVNAWQPSYQPPVSTPPQNYSATVPLGMPMEMEQIPATAPVIYAPPAKPANALLCLRTGPLAGNNYQCTPGRSVILGRDPSRCSLVLSQYPSVSALHCRIDIGDQFVTVTDLNSSNGTFVNGARLQPGQSVPVRAGGRVKLATDDCTFLIYFEK